MSNHDTIVCSEACVPYLERVNFFPRQLITADDMIQEQRYFRDKLRSPQPIAPRLGDRLWLLVSRKVLPWRSSSNRATSLGLMGTKSSSIVRSA